jgi:hypothetical protein
LTKKIIDAWKGRIIISDHFSISRVIMPEDLFNYFGRENVEINDVKNGYVHYTIRDIPIDGTIFSFILFFGFGKLDMVSFGFDYSADDTWENWSEEKELNRAAKYEKWLTMQVGRDRDFYWGNIWAAFDAKSGWSSLGLRFAQKLKPWYLRWLY